jgi:DNA modification methylase
MYTLTTGDCLEELKHIPDNSIDSVVGDPPAGISFMNMNWDKDKGGRDEWIAWMTDVMRECYRVLKPGGHVIIWALPRTSHWTASAIEDAGFKIRDRIHYLKQSSSDAERFINSLSPDQLQSLEIALQSSGREDIFYHVFGSGFPKSHNIGKGIDQAAGVEREVVRTPMTAHSTAGKGISNELDERPWMTEAREKGYHEHAGPLPATPEAELWEGWGTSLKPSVEHWVLAMKPRDGTYANNAQTWGVAGLNIDGARVETGKPIPAHHGTNGAAGRTFGERRECEPGSSGTVFQNKGRWPAHLVTDGSDEVVERFPNSDGSASPRTNHGKGNNCYGEYQTVTTQNDAWGDSGSTARYFTVCEQDRFLYTPKASRKERDAGLDDLDEKVGGGMAGTADKSLKTGSGNERNNKMRNHHPTVKALSLMRWLVRLTKTPTGGVVLDPFMGSGSTGVACIYEERDFVGIEMNPEYVEIARLRIEHAIEDKRTEQLKLF